MPKTEINNFWEMLPVYKILQGSHNLPNSVKIGNQFPCFPMSIHVSPWVFFSLRTGRGTARTTWTANNFQWFGAKETLQWNPCFLPQTIRSPRKDPNNSGSIEFVVAIDTNHIIYTVLFISPYIP